MLVHLRHTNRETGRSHVSWHILWSDTPDGFVAKVQSDYRELKEPLPMDVNIISEAEYQKEKGYKTTKGK